MTEGFSSVLSGLPCYGTNVLSTMHPHEGPGIPPAVYTVRPDDTPLPAALPAGLDAPPGDPLRILYIGGSRSMGMRAQRLIGSLRFGSRGRDHSAGWKVKYRLGIDSPTLIDILVLSIYPTDRPRQMERDLLAAYLRTYGMLPILNRRL